ncbi:MAG: MFS transporter [Rhodospirillales bacterium]|nr:MFS transporter [Rhodospirillales bacterium]
MGKPSPVQLIVMLCIAEIFSMLGAVTFPALLPAFIDSWQLTNTDAGWLNGIYYGGYLLAVPVLVSMTDHKSPLKIYLFGLLLTSLSGLGFAYAVDGFWSAMIFRTLGGIGLAGSYMPGLKLLTDHLDRLRPDADRSRAVAFYTSSFGIGTALFYFVAGETAAIWDWQTAFVIAAAGPLIAIAIAHFLLPEEDPGPRIVPDTHPLDFRPVLACKPAMAYVLAYAVHNFELFAYRSWLVAFLVYSASTQAGQSLLISATSWAAIANIFALPASVLGNELAKRIGRHKAITLIMWTSTAFACFIGFAAELPFIVVALLVVLYGITIAGESSSLTAGVVGAAPAGFRGATMAVHSCIGFMGSFAGPLIFGITLDFGSPTGLGGTTTASWGWAFALSGLVVGLGPVFIALLGRSRRE